MVMLRSPRRLPPRRPLHSKAMVLVPLEKVFANLLKTTMLQKACWCLRKRTWWLFSLRRLVQPDSALQVPPCLETVMRRRLDSRALSASRFRRTPVLYRLSSGPLLLLLWLMLHGLTLI